MDIGYPKKPSAHLWAAEMFRSGAIQIILWRGFYKYFALMGLATLSSLRFKIPRFCSFAPNSFNIFFASSSAGL